MTRQPIDESPAAHHVRADRQDTVIAAWLAGLARQATPRGAHVSPTRASVGSKPLALVATGELFERYHDGDLSLRSELVRRFMPLAQQLAGRYRHTAQPADDLEQIAYVGLIKSIDRYDPRLGSFGSYAVVNILGELKRHFRDKGWGIRVSRALQERVLEVNNAVEFLCGRLGRSPSARDVAKHTGMSLEHVLEALEAATVYAPAALDAPWAGDPDDQQTLGEHIGEEDPHFELVELGEAIGPIFGALPEREQRIVWLRFIDDLTQAEIADRLGVSQMHVSRLLRRSLQRLAVAARQ